MSQAPQRPTSPAAERGPLRERVRRRALALGFDVVGIARADEPIAADHDRYLAFVARGMHGEMGWLAANAGARLRLDGGDVLEHAKSVICVGRRYARAPEDEAADAPLARRIARYARGQDYHNHLRKKLRRLAAFVRGLGEGVEARPLCDVEPVLERAWAARAGIGFVGKNGLVITPGQGSYQLLGEVVTTLELEPDTPIAERCGSCTRCLDACPTSAFVAPFVLDPRRCISYWTIEARSAAPADLEEAVGEHLFGCDECQDVCPFNRTAAPPAARTAPFEPLARWSALGLDELAALDAESWDAVAEGSPIKRAGAAGLARNAALLAARRLASASDDPEAKRALERAASHPDRAVRDIAARALGSGRGEG